MDQRFDSSSSSKSPLKSNLVWQKAEGPDLGKAVVSSLFFFEGLSQRRVQAKTPGDIDSWVRATKVPSHTIEGALGHTVE